MIEQTCKYDPTIYGQLRAEFLENIDKANKCSYIQNVHDNEKKRQQLLKDIEEGRLKIVKP